MSQVLYSVSRGAPGDVVDSAMAAALDEAARLADTADDNVRVTVTIKGIEGEAGVQTRVGRFAAFGQLKGFRQLVAGLRWSLRF